MLCATHSLLWGVSVLIHQDRGEGGGWGETTGLTLVRLPPALT